MDAFPNQGSSAHNLVLLSGRIPYLKAINPVSHENKAVGIS